MSKSVKLTTLHGLPMSLNSITTDTQWFLDKIEKTQRNQYMHIFKFNKMSKRTYRLVYQDEKFTDIVITDTYGKKVFLNIKE